jgi:hypothetical protein
MPGTAARAVTWSRRAEPCRNQRRSIVAPCRLNDENSRAKLQNVREESSVGWIDGDAVRERLRERISQYEEAA